MRGQILVCDATAGTEGLKGAKSGESSFHRVWVRLRFGLGLCELQQEWCRAVLRKRNVPSAPSGSSLHKSGAFTCLVFQVSWFVPAHGLGSCSVDFMAVLGRKNCAFACLKLIVSLKILVPLPFVLKNTYCTFVCTLFLPELCMGVVSSPVMSLGLCIHPNIWHVCETLLDWWEFVCDWEQLAGWIAESWNHYGRNSLLFVFLQMLLFCAAFTSALGRTSEKLGDSWCHLVTSEVFWVLNNSLFVLYLWPDLQPHWKYSHPSTIAFLCLSVKGCFLQRWPRLIWGKEQLAAPCRNSCRNSPQILCSHKTGEAEAMPLLCPGQTIVSVAALGGKWQHSEES